MQPGAAPSNPDVEKLRQDALGALAGDRAGEAIRLLEKAVALEPRSGQLRMLLGRAFWQNGQPARAEKSFAEGERLAPRDAEVLSGYAGFLLGQLRLGEADAILRRAYAITRNHPEILNNIGLLHFNRGNLADAEPFFAQASRLNPQFADAFGNLANVLRDTKRYDKAEKAYRRALQLEPRNAARWREYGLSCGQSGDYGAAEDNFRRSIALDPSDDRAWFRLLAVLEGGNRLAAAAEALASAKQQFPGSLGLATFEAKLLRRQGKEQEALALLTAQEAEIATDAPRGHPFYYEFYFELGQLFDRAGDAARAFECFRKANEGQRQGTAAGRFQPGSVSANIARLKAMATPEWARQLDAAPVPADSGPQPVFLVGFPRSGTTLLDQILTSHPAITVAEEKPAVIKMIRWLEERQAGANGFRFDGNVASLAAEDITALREVFAAEHGGINVPGKPVFVDKLPLNLLHVPIIRRVFPRAKFLLALRHPCDSVLSCYMQNFKLNASMARFLDLEDSARFYDEAFGLWEQYRAVLPLDVHAVRYEDVVADFRPTVEGVLGFLGVEWNDAVLAYDKTARERTRIRTPSYHQVTEKIYTRASGRWLRYREQMKPVLHILEPHARRYGYDMGEDESPADRAAE